MKRLKKWMIAMGCVVLSAMLFVSCGKGSNLGGSSSDSGSGNTGSSDITSSGGSSSTPQIEDVDFATRETVSYAPESANGSFSYGGTTYSSSEISEFTEIGVNPWEKNVKFRFVADSKRTDNQGWFNLLASATNNCAGKNKRYFIPGVKLFEEYAQFYNYWSDGSTTFNVFAKNGLKFALGVPYEITVGFGNVKADGVIKSYKIYFKMTTISGEVLYDGTYALAVNVFDGVPYDYSVESETNTPSLGIGFWSGAAGSKHFLIKDLSQNTPAQYKIYYELPEGVEGTLDTTEQTVTFGEAFELVIPNIEGFEKWVHKDGEHVGEEFVNGTYLVEGDVYLVAVITPTQEGGDDGDEYEKEDYSKDIIVENEEFSDGIVESFGEFEVGGGNENEDGGDNGQVGGGFITPDVPNI